MSSSAGWVRVAGGLRLVASAAASHSAKEANTFAARVAQHGVDLAANARTAAAAMPEVSHFQSNYRREDTVAHNASTKMEFNVANTILEKAENTSQANNSSMTKEIVNASNLKDDIHVDNRSPLPSRAFKDFDGKQELLQSHVEEEEKDGTPDLSESHDHQEEDNARYERLKVGRPIPTTRVSRAFGFASLGLGLAAGTAAGMASRLVGISTSSSESGSSSQQQQSIVATDANADRLAASLCRMRGAALKLGQMLSIQDESLLPPALSRALKQVRQGADAMPTNQLLSQIESELGSRWRDKLHEFDEVPFAAASIGQVHRAAIKDENGTTKKVVMKVQYPGVANSIESDLSNLSMLVTMTGLAPPGLFIEEVIRVGRNEIMVECDYLNELENQRRFKKLVESDRVLKRERFTVPGVICDLTTPHILTSEYAPGGTIDKVAHLDQNERNRIGRNILRLTMLELFVWRFMQTDPNWGNFLYDVGTQTTSLIDFGAAREYSKSFVDGYLRIVWAAANQDGDTVMSQSHLMGFLTGEENDIMLEAHKMSGFTVGEPFRSNEPFDFRGSNISTRLSQQSSAFFQHRLTPPPEEVYTLHRKLAGAYMLCIKLGAVIDCRDLLEEIVTNHSFDDGESPSVGILEKANL